LHEPGAGDVDAGDGEVEAAEFENQGPETGVVVVGKGVVKGFVPVADAGDEIDGEDVEGDDEGEQGKGGPALFGNPIEADEAPGCAGGGLHGGGSE
jgi:hypothetical protein